MVASTRILNLAGGTGVRLHVVVMVVADLLAKQVRQWSRGSTTRWMQQGYQQCPDHNSQYGDVSVTVQHGVIRHGFAVRDIGKWRKSGMEDGGTWAIRQRFSIIIQKIASPPGGWVKEHNFTYP